LTDTPTSQYLHADHAGNFADLYKHARLIALLRALGAEAGPRVYLESHAGAGSYDLDPASRAWRSGFGRLVERDELPAPVAELRAHVTRTGGHWRYPGSPRLAAALLASRDRLCLVERDPETHARLRAEFAGDPRCSCLAGDGFALIPTQLPAATTPGLLLVDPPYLDPGDAVATAALLATCRARWSAGTLAAWYPRRADGCDRRLRDALAERDLGEFDDDWIDTVAAGRGGMHGCGMLVLNAPAGFATRWRPSRAWLAASLTVPGTAHPDRPMDPVPRA
jgi:23S rRNA (adenine2030-N6)-methyltransferase